MLIAIRGIIEDMEEVRNVEKKKANNNCLTENERILLAEPGEYMIIETKKRRLGSRCIIYRCI